MICDALLKEGISDDSQCLTQQGTSSDLLWDLIWQVGQMSSHVLVNLLGKRELGE